MARGGADKVSSKKDTPKVNFWCRWIATRPGLFFGIFLSMHICSVLLTVILLFSGYNILPTVFDGLPLEMNGDTMFLRNEAWDYRNENLDNDSNSTNSRRRRSLELPGMVPTMENSLKNHNTGSIVLNLQEDLEKQLWGAEPSLAAGKLLRASLGGSDSAQEVPRFLSDEATRLMEDKPFLPRLEECCGSSLSGLLMKKGNCWCDPHSTPTAESNRIPNVHSQHRTKRETTDPLDERRKTLTSITIIYEEPNGNIFTKENLRKIARFEYDLYNSEDFRKHYCKTFKLQGALHCQAFSSVLRFFDGSYSSEDDKFFDPSLTDIPGVIGLAYEMESLKDAVTFYLASDAVVNKTKNIAISSRTRTMISYGYPYADYLDKTDDVARGKQNTIWRRWAQQHLVPLFTSSFENGIFGLDFYYVSRSLYWAEALSSVTGDLAWLAAGFAFIYLFMLFQTGSFWITSFGMGSVLSTFFGANLLYNIVIGYKFFGIFNVLALFIVLGIGADDIFIFSDTWKLYATCKFDSLEERLSVVFKRAAIAMFVTSLTTMVAFFVSSFSPLLPISAFGTYAGLCIFINYLSVISFFPSVIILYHKYFEKYSCCCCGLRNAKKEKPPLPNTENGVRPQSRNSIASVENVENSTENLKTTADDGSTMPRSDKINAAIVNFLKTKFFSFVTHKIVRIVILVLFVGLMAACLYSGLQVKLDNSDIRLFDPWTVQEQSNTKNTYGFKTTMSEPTLDLTLIWGLGLQDRSQCKPLEYNSDSPCTGETSWVEEFNLDDEVSQNALLGFCKKLSSGLDPTLRDQLRIAYDATTKKNDITCFIEDMDTFYQTEHLQPEYPAGVNLSLPMTVAKMQTIMTYHPLIYNPSTVNQVTRPFELAVYYWLRNRYSNETIPDNRGKYTRYMGLEKIKTIDVSADEDREIYQAKLRYLGVEVATTVPSRRVDLTTATPLMEQWENFVNTEMESMPPTLEHAFQTSRLWVWINILQNLSTQSFSAFGIGLALAFIVIFLGTQNIITGFVATLMLACVTCSVIAVIPLAGWKFGLLEGLNFCLIVGLAVDYIVHLAEGYHMSSYTGRLDRVRDTLEKVGISILSGAITTLGASFFMVFAKILFFKQFGIFLFCTIGCSMVFALFVMLAGYSIFGPEGYFASFVPLCRDRGKYREHKGNGEKGGEQNGGFQMETKSTPM